MTHSERTRQFRTRSCQLYRAGSCSRGDACIFTHDQSLVLETRATAEASLAYHAPSSSSTKASQSMLVSPLPLQNATLRRLSVSSSAASSQRSQPSATKASQCAPTFTTVPSNAVTSNDGASEQTSSSTPGTIQRSASLSQASNARRKDSKESCRAWSAGSCSRGEKCQFSHDLQLQDTEGHSHGAEEEIVKEGQERAECSDTERAKHEAQELVEREAREHARVVARERASRRRAGREARAEREAEELTKRKAEERRAAEERQREGSSAVDERQLAEERRRAEVRRLVEERRLAEERRLTERRRPTQARHPVEERQAAKERRLADVRRHAEERRHAEGRQREEQRLAEGRQRAEGRRIAEECRAAEERRIAEERRCEEQRPAEVRRLAEERWREEQRLTEERRRAEEHQRAEERRLAEERQLAEERRRAEAEAEQVLVPGEWIQQQGRNVKKCPECNRLMERAGGCNHMTCKCGTHVCWLCSGVFTADTIYPHMNSAHGGIYEEDHGRARAVAIDSEAVNLRGQQQTRAQAQHFARLVEEERQRERERAARAKLARYREAQEREAVRIQAERFRVDQSLAEQHRAGRQHYNPPLLPSRRDPMLSPLLPPQRGSVLSPTDAADRRKRENASGGCCTIM